MDTADGVPGDGTQRSTLLSFLFSRDFWKGAYLELLEVPSGPRWKGGRSLDPTVSVEEIRPQVTALVRKLILKKREDL